MAQKPIRVLEGVPIIDSEQKNEDLLPGQYGQGYDADGNLKVFKKGDNAPLSNKWGLQEDIISTLFFLGAGAKVFGALDYAASKVVPGGDDPSLSEAISEQASQRELFRETNPVLSAAGQTIASLGPIGVANKLSKVIRNIPMANRTVGNIPKFIRSLFQPALITGTVAGLEADPGRELSEFETGAERGAITAAVLYPLLGTVQLLSGGVRGRFNPKWGARNMVNMAANRHDLSRIAETATEEELAAMSPALRNMAPAFREIYRRFIDLGPDAIITDAFPEGIPALLNLFTKQAGATRDMLKGILEDRRKSETERLIAGADLYVSNLTGAPNDLSKALVEMAGPHYDHAIDVKYEGGDSDLPFRDDNLPATMAQLEEEAQRDFTHVPGYNTDLMSPELAKLLGTDSGKRAFNEALRSFGDEKFYSQYSRKQAVLELQRILDNAVYEGGVLKGISSQSAGFSLEFLDRIKRKLDSRVSKARTSGDSDTSRVVGNIANRLRGELDRLDETGPNPGKKGNSGSYKLARDTAKSNISLQEAYELGLDFRNVQPKDITITLSKMSEGEKNMYRAGAASALRRLIERIPASGRATSRLFDNTYSMKQMESLIRAEEWPAFKEMVDRELAFAETENLAMGRGVGQIKIDPASEETLKTASVLAAGKAVPTVNILLLAGQVRRSVTRFLQGGGADEEAVKMLLEQDPKVVQSMLQSLSALPQSDDNIRLRDLIVQASALQTRLLGEKRVQVPVGTNQYEVKRQPRTPLGDYLRWGGDAVRSLIP